MIYMNDCKKDINKIITTDEDLKHKNVDWIHVWQNGWPKILAISCKDIKKDDWLFTGYGMSYTSLELSKRLFKEQLKMNKERIYAILNQNNVDIRL